MGVTFLVDRQSTVTYQKNYKGIAHMTEPRKIRTTASCLQCYIVSQIYEKQLATIKKGTKNNNLTKDAFIKSNRPNSPDTGVLAYLFDRE